MNSRRSMLIVLFSALLLCAVASKEHAATAAPTHPTTKTVAVKAEKPIQPEKNPPSKIPDSHAINRYGYAANKLYIEVPEGWVRKENGKIITFMDKHSGEKIVVSTTKPMSTVANAKKAQVTTIEQRGRGVSITPAN